MYKYSISVIVPAYNEEEILGNNLQKISSFLKKGFKKYEIIVVADGSTDRTIEIAKSFPDTNIIVLANKKNRGKGFSVRKGMLHAKNELAIFTDADLSTPIEELDNFMQHIEEYDVIIGSRKTAGSKIEKKQAFLRRIIGGLSTFFVGFLGTKGFKDTQCGFKLFKNCAKQLFSKQKTKRWMFDVEILLIAGKKGLKILEIPVIWRNREESKVDPVLDSIRSFFDLLRIRINCWIGRY